MSVDIESFLSQLPFFSALPREEIHTLTRVLRPTTYSAQALMFLEGDPGDRLYIVVEGEIEILKNFGTPDERILNLIRPGDILGEMALLYPHGKRSASARTRSEVKLLELGVADFNPLFDSHPHFAIHILRGVSERLQNSENATIWELSEKNRQLAQAYIELKAAQMQIIEKEKLEHELNMARKIQESILPKSLPELPGLKITAYWQPAKSVSGDFYDFFTFAGGELGFLVGDVTGKGVPAALVMATTCSIIRATVEQCTFPGQVLARANNVLCRSIPEGMFVTCFFAVLDPTSGSMSFANAGHNLPCQISGVQVKEIRATGMPLGLMQNMIYEEKEALLDPGDRLVLFSDGLVEAHNSAREMYGTSRLMSRLECRKVGEELIVSLLADLSAFAGSEWEQEDDITLVCLERS